jgi:hypothetical protein
MKSNFILLFCIIAITFINTKTSYYAEYLQWKKDFGMKYQTPL